MQDQILDWIVVALPTLFSIVGVLVTLEPWDTKHKQKWRIGLVVFGIAMSLFTYRQQERQRAKAREDASEFLAHVEAEEHNSKEQFNALTEKFNAFVALHPLQQRPITVPKSLTAEEIALAVSKQLKDSPPAPSQSPERNTATIAPPVRPVAVQPEAMQPPPVKPCRGDRLSECTQEQLLEWGKPLVAKIEAVENDYMADIKKTDDIKSGWLGEFVGDFIGGGSDASSKRVKAFAVAKENASDQFRNCCAENTLAYHKELTLRNGGGVQNAEVYEWIQNLLKPQKSKEWKKARQDFSLNIFSLISDLSSLELKLKIDEINRQQNALLDSMHAKH